MQGAPQTVTCRATQRVPAAMQGPLQMVTRRATQQMPAAMQGAPQMVARRPAQLPATLSLFIGVLSQHDSAGEQTSQPALEALRRWQCSQPVLLHQTRQHS